MSSSFNSINTYGIIRKPTFTPEFKYDLARLHCEDGRTIRSLANEYGVGASTLCQWIRMYREGEGFMTKLTSSTPQGSEAKTTKDLERENKILNKKLQERDKEIAFLKQAAAYFAKGK